MLTWDLFLHLLKLLLCQMHQPLTAAFQCHAVLKRFLLLSNRNPVAAIGPFDSTNLKQISLRSVVHCVTWIVSSLYYIIFLIMYEFFCSNAVQASLMSLVGWYSELHPPSQKKIPWKKPECCAIISLNEVLIIFFCVTSVLLFWPCFYIAIICF